MSHSSEHGTAVEAPSATSGRPDPYRIPATGRWANAWKVALVFGVLGLGLSAFGYSLDRERFAFSWLFAFMTFLTMGLGALFFVLIQHLTVSGWSVTVRRTAEFLAAGLPVFAILFIPVIVSAPTLYEQWLSHDEQWQGHDGDHGAGQGDADGAGANGEHGSLDPLSPSLARAQDHADAAHGAEGGGQGEHAQAAGHHDTPQHALHAEVLEHKSSYLNWNFWLLRAALYFLIWIALSLFYFRTSVAQDESKKVSLTARMQSMAPVSMILFGVTLTFSGIDWMMSLEPAWFSTIYGVYIFAGSAIAAYALVIVVTLSLRSDGLLGNAVNVEHYHDLGKMTFGFVVFWAYIGFSQMMLIWYASVPEELTYYHLRWTGGWKGVSLFLLLTHFVLPFFFMISRVVKRQLPLLGFGCMWLLVMHAVDIYWFVLPYFHPGEFSAHWLDVTCLAGVGGTYFAVVFFSMRRHALIPLGDPRLSRALSLQNA